MAWTGDVIRSITAVRHFTKENPYNTLVFDCGHEQPTDLPADKCMRLRYSRAAETPNCICVQCSKPHWQRISDYQRSISFPDVLAKICSLNTAEGAD